MKIIFALLLNLHYTTKSYDKALFFSLNQITAIKRVFYQIAKIHKFLCCLMITRKQGLLCFNNSQTKVTLFLFRNFQIRMYSLIFSFESDENLLSWSFLNIFITTIKGRVHCFSMQVAMNKWFFKTLKKNWCRLVLSISKTKKEKAHFISEKWRHRAEG